MNKVALDLGLFQIYWYSLFILLGVILASTIIYLEMKKQKIDNETFVNMAFNTIIAGIIGARLYYVMFDFSYYLSNPLQIIQTWNGGLAIHGGILFGCLYIVYFCRKNKLKTLKILDIIVVGLILGQAIGRWGNFFNQEAYGAVTTLSSLNKAHIPDFIIKGMHISENYYQPTFLYESLWDIVGFVILLFVRRIKKLKIGQLTGAYLIWYSVGRFFIEKMRSDSLMLGPIKIAQAVSIILILVGSYLIFINSKSDNLYRKRDN